MQIPAHIKLLLLGGLSSEHLPLTVLWGADCLSYRQAERESACRQWTSPLLNSHTDRAQLLTHHHEVWGDPGRCWRLLQVPVPALVNPVPPPCHPPPPLPPAQLHLRDTPSPLRPQEPGGWWWGPWEPLDPPWGGWLLQLLQHLRHLTDLQPRPRKQDNTLSTRLDLRPITVQLHNCHRGRRSKIIKRHTPKIF